MTGLEKFSVQFIRVVSLLYDTPRDQRSTWSRAVASSSAKRTEWHRVRTDANTAETADGEGGSGVGRRGGGEEGACRGRRVRWRARGGEGGGRLAGARGRGAGRGARADSAVSGRPLASLVAPRLRAAVGVGTMHGPRLGGTREAGRACERRWSAQFGSRHCESPSCLAHRDRFWIILRAAPGLVNFPLNPIRHIPRRGPPCAIPRCRNPATSSPTNC